MVASVKIGSHFAFNESLLPQRSPRHRRHRHRHRRLYRVLREGRLLLGNLHHHHHHGAHTGKEVDTDLQNYSKSHQ